MDFENLIRYPSGVSLSALGVNIESPSSIPQPSLYAM
jgi:hypothetical protein